MSLELTIKNIPKIDSNIQGKGWSNENRASEIKKIEELVRSKEAELHNQHEVQAEIPKKNTL